MIIGTADSTTFWQRTWRSSFPVEFHEECTLASNASSNTFICRASKLGNEDAVTEAMASVALLRNLVCKARRSRAWQQTKISAAHIFMRMSRASMLMRADTKAIELIDWLCISA